MDEFWDVKEQERREESELRQQIDKIGRVLTLGQRAHALKSAEGFQDFMKAIDDLRIHALRQLVECAGSDADVRILQGKVRGIRDILSILKRSGESMELLASQRDRLQNQLEETMKRRPQRQETAP